MRVVTTELDGVLLFEPTPHRDARGFFRRTSDNAVLASAGIDPTVPQDSRFCSCDSASICSSRMLVCPESMGDSSPTRRVRRGLT